MTKLLFKYLCYTVVINLDEVEELQLDHEVDLITLKYASGNKCLITYDSDDDTLEIDNYTYVIKYDEFYRIANELFEGAYE
jgi:hypothetical protein